MFDISFLGKPIAWAWRVGGHLRIYKDMQELASFNVSNVPAIQTPIGFVFSPDLDAAELRYNLADGVEVYESKWAKTLLDNPHNQLCVLFERGLLVSWKEQLPATISLDALTQITHKCYRTSVRETHLDATGTSNDQWDCC